MKKVIFGMLLLMATISLSAQVTVQRLESTSTNPAYTVPDYIRVNFETAYPTVTVVNWAPVNEMWRATYNDNNRMTRIYYNQTGEMYRLALPVISTHVPEEVVTSAINLYGESLYDITKMKAADNTDVYQVRLMENSTPRSVWMNESGVVMTSGVYKIKIEDDKMKIKSDDEMKIKNENQ
jgi:hypothetical protein